MSAIRPARSLAFLLLTTLPISAQIVDDWVAPAGTSVLDTSFTQIKSTQNRTITVRGGVFVLRNVTIPRGAIVEGVGVNPMIWIVTGDFQVDGELSVDGQDGADSLTLNSANFPVAGGRGGPAAGDGGRGSPSTVGSSLFGASGDGPYQTAGFGGGGGSLAVGISAAHFGGGGGGGVFGAAGDAAFAPIFQASGVGGFGRGSAGPVPGGAIGKRIFVDPVADNDFWGIGYDVFQRRVVFGELPILIGGSGGGGGGDRTNSPNFIFDETGGGGGGGGGCLVIYAFGKIRIHGKVHANGGAGGGGEQAGGSIHAGGGGAGSGGMLVLITRDEIILATRGETFDRGDSDFCLAADGGISRQSGWQGPRITSKYQSLTGLRPNAGGFGGPGLLQLMAPVGTNQDGTNTVLDDRITLLRGATKLSGSEKQRYLAWRGWVDKNGRRIDDAGKPIAVSRGGDMRPSPILLPVF